MRGNERSSLKDSTYQSRTCQHIQKAHTRQASIDGDTCERQDINAKLCCQIKPNTNIHRPKPVPGPTTLHDAAKLQPCQQSCLTKHASTLAHISHCNLYRFVFLNTQACSNTISSPSQEPAAGLYSVESHTQLTILA